MLIYFIIYFQRTDTKNEARKIMSNNFIGSNREKETEQF